MPRAVAWEPGKAICGTCKSKLYDVLGRITCDVFSSRCRGLWCLPALKCTYAVIFLAANTVRMIGV